MNIPLFIESLSDIEKEELKTYFLKQESHKNNTRITIKEFIEQNQIPTRIANLLLTKTYDYDYGNGSIYKGYGLDFADEICKETFMRIRNAGHKSWEELEKILTKQKTNNNN